MCAAGRDGRYDPRPNRSQTPTYTKRGHRPSSGGYPQRPGGRKGQYPRTPPKGGKHRTLAPPYDSSGAKRPKPSDPKWGEPELETELVRGGPDKDSEEDDGASRESLAMLAGILYMLMVIYLFFMFFWRDGGREFVMFELALSMIIIFSIAIFLSLSHDLTFIPVKVSVYWTNFIAGLLTMVVMVIMIKMMKDFSSGPYDTFDDFNVIVSVCLGTGATYLLLHSMWYDRKEVFVQDRVPIAFLSGFAWAGLGGFVFFFFFDEPFTRFVDAAEIFYIALTVAIIGGFAVFFNLLGKTYFAPRWATRSRMNFLSGILLGIILFLVLITGLMFNAPPYEIWDTVRVSAVSGIASFAMASGVFSMGM